MLPPLLDDADDATPVLHAPNSKYTMGGGAVDAADELESLVADHPSGEFNERCALFVHVPLAHFVAAF